MSHALPVEPPPPSTSARRRGLEWEETADIEEEEEIAFMGVAFREMRHGRSLMRRL